MNIEWRPVVGYEGEYLVSNTGLVKSLKFKKPRILKNQKNKWGYYRINLKKDGKEKLLAVHRLVAQAFIENPLNLPFVNHKDECKTNNNVSNLEWCTQKYNINYGMAQQKRMNAQRYTGKKRFRPVCQIKDGVVIATYESEHEAARKTGCRQSSICSVVNHKRLKSTGGYEWKFAEEVI
jgi:hypothetical protein